MKRCGRASGIYHTVPHLHYSTRIDNSECYRNLHVVPNNLVNVAPKDLLNANRAEDARRARRTVIVTDHEGGDVLCNWFVPSRETGFPLKHTPPLSYQVYVLDAAIEGSDPQVLDHFCAVMYCLFRDFSCTHENKNRFDIYQTPREDYLACVEHQRKEIDWRDRNGTRPRLVSSWSASPQDGGDRGFILVIDSVDIVKHGITLVYFDPDEYHDPIERRRVWHLAGYGGDFDLLHAIRARTTESLHLRLLRAQRRADMLSRTNLRFTDEGSTSRAEQRAGLERLSPTTFRFTDVGSSSWALPPALEPTTRDYAEYDEDEDEELFFSEQQHAVDDTADGISEDENLQPDGRLLIIDRFRCNELRTMPGLGAKRYRTETYEDSHSQRTVSVWDSTVSATRPPFSMTLYCGSSATFSAESLFGCLNKGLVSMEPWTLDVKRGFDSLSQAHVHQRREASRRSSSRVLHRRSCMRMLVRKIASERLPLELCDVIQEKLIFPLIPDYACSQLRPFRNLLLYFAPKSSVRSLSQGPLLVFSNPSRLLAASSADCITTSGAPQRPGLLGPDTEELRVKHLRFWHRVADEIHTLASLCATVDSVFPQHEFIPSATISIDPPLWDSGTLNSVDSHLVTLRVNSSQTLTLHTHELFSHDLFSEALQLVDLTADRVLPQMPFVQDTRQTLRHDDSWSTSAGLGLSTLSHGENLSTSASLGLSIAAHFDSRFRRIQALEPGQSFQWPWNCESYLNSRKHRRELIDGHRYALRANPNIPLKVVRWTYGKPGAMERVCGRPPIPVSLEHEVTFTIHKDIDSSGWSRLYAVPWAREGHVPAA